VLAPALDGVADRLGRLGFSPGGLTAAGFVFGLGCCAAAATGHWTVALLLWLANRTFDGLDGALARRGGASDLGGMLDFVADSFVYAAFPVAVALALPDARIAVAFLLAAYLVNNVALLSFSSILERRALPGGDGRSLRFTTGLTEGTETAVCYALVCLLPAHAGTIFWVFAAMVAVTIVQRLRLAKQTLR
jgi:phosphatidylglycerophosphate synthase